MATTDGSRASPDASLEDLVAITSEMAALARAGVPLERGLTDVARDLPRSSGKLAADLAARMQTGESLSHILSTSPGLFPKAYRAVIEAGIRSGRLAAALEGVAGAARRALEFRTLARAALVYPLVVLLLAYALFVFSITHYQPLVYQAYERLNVPTNQLNVALVNLGQTANRWAPWVPLMIIAPVAVWWNRAGRVAADGGRWLGRIFPAWRLVRYGRIATFADVLALLVERDVPMSESITLAADASGDGAMQRCAGRLSATIAQGDRSFRSDTAAELPALLTWLLSSDCDQQCLAEALRQTAATYRRRARQLDNWLRLYLPVVLCLVIGGTAVVIYALVMFVPWINMLLEFAAQT